MFQDKFVFSQLTAFLDRNHFNYLVRKYGGDKYVKHLTCWSKKKGGVKAHVLYDLEAQVPAFYHITTASVYGSKAMPEIPYETGAYYVFDRGYNNFGELYRI